MLAYNKGKREEGGEEAVVLKPLETILIHQHFFDVAAGGRKRSETLKESCKGLGSVSLKINNQHTHTPFLAPLSLFFLTPPPEAEDAAAQMNT